MIIKYSYPNVAHPGGAVSDPPVASLSLGVAVFPETDPGVSP